MGSFKHRILASAFLLLASLPALAGAKATHAADSDGEGETSVRPQAGELDLTSLSERAREALRNGRLVGAANDLRLKDYEIPSSSQPLFDQVMAKIKAQQELSRTKFYRDLISKNEGKLEELLEAFTKEGSLALIAAEEKEACENAIETASSTLKTLKEKRQSRVEPERSLVDEQISKLEHAVTKKRDLCTQKSLALKLREEQRKRLGDAQAELETMKREYRGMVEWASSLDEDAQRQAATPIAGYLKRIAEKEIALQRLEAFAEDDEHKLFQRVKAMARLQGNLEAATLQLDGQLKGFTDSSGRKIAGYEEIIGKINANIQRRMEAELEQLQPKEKPRSNVDRILNLRR